MNVRPLSDRLIVQRLEEGEQQVGGIIIPDTAKERPQQGKVIAAGQILFGKYAGQEIKLDGQEYLIMKEDDVLAVIEGNGKNTLVGSRASQTQTKR